MNYSRFPSEFTFMCLAVAVAAVLGGCGSDKELSNRPSQSGTAPTIETHESTVGVLVSVALADVQQMAEKAVPDKFSDSGNGEDVCGKVLGAEICAGTRYSFDANRGSITLSAANPQTLRVSVPVSISGKGGFRGDGAKLLGLNAKNFSAAAIFTVDITPGLSPQWCPQFDVQASYTWTASPKVEIVGGVWVDVKKQVEDQIYNQLPKLKANLANAVDCKAIREPLEKAYAVTSAPLQVPQLGTLYANVTPASIGFSGLQVTPSEISAAATITAKVEISTAAARANALPLPDVTTIPVSVPKIQVALPVRASYSVLTEQLNRAVAGQTFAQKTATGTVSVKVRGLEVYPSNGKLVVGFDMEATTPRGVPNAKGKIYLLGTPKVNGTVVSLADASFATVLDQAFWQVVASLFESEIKSAINRAARYDLANDMARGKQALAIAVASTTAAGDAKLAVKVDEVDMRPGRIVAADGELVAEGLFSAVVTVGIKG